MQEQEPEEVEEKPVESQAIVLHEDKRYYPKASEVYGTAEATI